jgi:hypothetical protein
MKLVLFIVLIMRNIVRLKEFLISLNQPVVISNNKGKTKNSTENVFGFHFEETLDLKIALARKMIAKFCQKVKDTPNHDRITPRSHASKKRPATARTTTPKATPRAVEVFIDQAVGT